MKWFHGVTVVALAAFFSVGHTEPSFDGSASFRGDVWTGDRNLDDEGFVGTTSVWANGKANFGAAGTFVGDAWLRAQTNGDYRHDRVREFYWRNDFGPVDVKIGQQMVIWGRADGLNPTDNLAPHDYTTLAPEDGDLRYGNVAAAVSVDTRFGTFSGFWFPRSATDTIPLQPLAGVNYIVERAPDRSQWAAKWEGSHDGIDGSISYFQGADPVPDLLPGQLTAQGASVLVRSQSTRILGADFSLERRGVVWRGEMALKDTDSNGADDFTHKKPQFWLVTGPEFQVGGSATVSVQATVQHVFDFEDPGGLPPGPLRELALRQAATSNQTSANQLGVTWRIAKRWRNDTLLGEISGVSVWPGGNGVVRGKLDYAVNDHVHVQAGVEYYFGPFQSYFGQLHANSLAYVQVRYGL